MPGKRNPDDKMSRLIGAVGETLKEEGYPGLGMNRIALRAGVGKPMVYEYFGNLNGLRASLPVFSPDGRHVAFNDANIDSRYSTPGDMRCNTATRDFDFWQLWHTDSVCCFEPRGNVARYFIHPRYNHWKPGPDLYGIPFRGPSLEAVDASNSPQAVPYADERRSGRGLDAHGFRRVCATHRR